MSVDVGWVAALAEREAPRLLSYFERRVGVREDAADLLGETLLVLWRRSSDIPASDIEAAMWLFGVARRVLAGHRRGGKRRLALAERLRNELAVTSDMTDEVADECERRFARFPNATENSSGSCTGRGSRWRRRQPSSESVRAPRGCDTSVPGRGWPPNSRSAA
jgi:DNA-directed RNA polymerase specialized sigma24 family protein